MTERDVVGEMKRIREYYVREGGKLSKERVSSLFQVGLTKRRSGDRRVQRG